MYKWFLSPLCGIPCIHILSCIYIYIYHTWILWASLISAYWTVQITSETNCSHVAIYESNSKNHCSSFWAKNMRIPPPLKNQPTPKRNSGFSKGLTSHHGLFSIPPSFFWVRQKKQSETLEILGRSWTYYPWTPKPWNLKVLHHQYMGYNPQKWRNRGFPWYRLLFIKII